MAVQSDKLRLLRRIPQIRFEEELRGYSKSQVDRVLEKEYFFKPDVHDITDAQNRDDHDCRDNARYGDFCYLLVTVSAVDN